MDRVKHRTSQLGNAARSGWRWPILLVALTMTACAVAPVQHLQRARYTQYQQPQRSELTVQEEERLGTLCPFGTPVKASDWDFGFTEYVVRDGYALEHSGDHKVPLWVCERLEAHASDQFKRPDSFKPDPLLDGPRSELADYRHSGYARGHHAPAADFDWDRRLLDETFYLSNMSPQAGPFNSGIWAGLEKSAREWSEQGQVTWIITGTMFYDPEEEDTNTADGWIPYFTIGSGVAVPTHLYKIVVRQDAAGQIQVASFVVDNKKPPGGYSIFDFARSVRWIEERTGFDFMPELEPGQSDQLELIAAPAWPPP